MHALSPRNILLAFQFIVIFVLVIFSSGCQSEENCDDCAKTNNMFSNGGVFISNEGLFQTGTGTVSFWDKKTNEVKNDIYKTKNGADLGNILQSFTLINGNVYLVINNAQKIVYVDTLTFQHIGEITGLELPRYMCAISNQKAYITQWGKDGLTGSVKVYDLSLKKIIKTIPVGKGAEQMLNIGNQLFVTCQGGYDNENRLFVINTLTDAVEKTITIGYGARGIHLDNTNQIWVLCSGRWNANYTALTDPSELYKLSPNGDVVRKISFDSKATTADNLKLNANKNALYYTYHNQTFKMNTSDTLLPNKNFMLRSFYALGVDPKTDNVYGADAGNFTSSGKVIRFDNTGKALDSCSVGVIPNGFYFY